MVGVRSTCLERIAGPERGAKANSVSRLTVVAALSVFLLNCSTRRGEYSLRWAEDGETRWDRPEWKRINFSFVDYPGCHLQVESNSLGPLLQEMGAEVVSAEVGSKRYICCLRPFVWVKIGTLTHAVREVASSPRAECPP